MCVAMSAVHRWAQAWQGAALDALAAWLSEDASRVEPRLAQREACQRFVALFAAYAPAGDSEALSRLLKPFLRILRHSKRITVRLARSRFWEGWLVAQAGRPGSSYITLNCGGATLSSKLKSGCRPHLASMHSVFTALHQRSSFRMYSFWAAPKQVEMGQGGLTPIVLDTLAQTSALTALDLLQVLRTLFEFHPRPKQYVAQHGILEHLQRLASGGDRSRRQSVLVQKQAGSLLQALRVQSVI